MSVRNQEEAPGPLPGGRRDRAWEALEQAPARERTGLTPLAGGAHRHRPWTGTSEQPDASWTEVLRSIGSALRAFLFRNARQTMPRTMKIGRPEDYQEGVDTRWRDRHGLWIVRNASGIYALRSATEGPWPVLRVGILLDEDGQIVVDRRKTFRYEAGEWDNPDSFLSTEP